MDHSPSPSLIHRYDFQKFMVLLALAAAIVLLLVVREYMIY